MEKFIFFRRQLDEKESFVNSKTGETRVGPLSWGASGCPSVTSRVNVAAESTKEISLKIIFLKRF